MAPPNKPVVGNLYDMEQQPEMHGGAYAAVRSNQGRGRYPAHADPRAQPRRPAHRRLGVIQQPEGAPDPGADAAEAAAGVRTPARRTGGAHGTASASRGVATDAATLAERRGESRPQGQLRDPSGMELTCLTACADFGPSLRSIAWTRAPRGGGRDRILVLMEHSMILRKPRTTIALTRSRPC